MTTEERMALDAEVHRKVFGRECRPLKWGPWFGDKAGQPILDRPQRDLETRESIPLYSEDIAEAWSVVERMRELGWHLSLTDLAGDWTAIFAHNGEKRMRTAAPSAPVAICRAALEAVKQSEG